MLPYGFCGFGFHLFLTLYNLHYSFRHCRYIVSNLESDFCTHSVPNVNSQNLAYNLPESVHLPAVEMYSDLQDVLHLKACLALSQLAS